MHIYMYVWMYTCMNMYILHPIYCRFHSSQRILVFFRHPPSVLSVFAYTCRLSVMHCLPCGVFSSPPLLSLIPYGYLFVTCLWIAFGLFVTCLWLAFDLFVTLFLTCLWLCFWLGCDLLLLLLTSLWLAFALFGTFFVTCLLCLNFMDISYCWNNLVCILFCLFVYFVLFVCIKTQKRLKNNSLSLFKSDKQRPNFRGRPPFNKNNNSNNNNSNKDTVKYLRTTTTLRIILCGRFYAPCITHG